MSRSGALATSRSMEQRHKLKSEHTSKLEVESQRMEARLKMLKTMLAAEKTRRNVEGAIHWKSTKSGSQKKPVRGAPSEGQSPGPSKPVRVRVLTDKTKKNTVSTLSSTQCGQCDKSYASLCCVECVENYCQVCFVKIHQKGALANHHVKPLLSKVTVKPGEKLKVKFDDEAGTRTDMKCVSATVGAQEASNSLLNGAYNEESSAASFQEALAEWRKAGDSKTSTASANDKTKQSSSISTSMSPDAATSEEQKKVEISFSQNAGVSYFEKLITRRSRYDPTLLKKMAPKLTMPASLPLEVEDSNEIMDYTPSKYNIFYETDGTADIDFEQDCEELYQPMSSIQIEEITEPPSINSKTPKPKEAPQVTTTKTANLKARDTSSAKLNTQKQKTKKKAVKKSRPSSTAEKQQSTRPSQMTETEVYSSVHKAWTDCSKNNTSGLSSFFLQGVEPSISSDTPINQLHTQSDTQVQFPAATIWLPSNSVTTDQKTIVEDSDSDSEDLSRCNSALSYVSQHDLESTEILAERMEWDKEDDNALNSLACELTSTIESEGRLSRCNSMLDSIDDNFPQSEEEPVECEVQVETVDMDQVVSEFELYQQQLLDEEM